MWARANPSTTFKLVHDDLTLTQHKSKLQDILQNPHVQLPIFSLKPSRASVIYFISPKLKFTSKFQSRLGIHVVSSQLNKVQITVEFLNTPRDFTGDWTFRTDDMDRKDEVP